MRVRNLRITLLTGFVLLVTNPSTTFASICGDINGDNTGPDIADLVYFVEYMFQGGPPPLEMFTADVNADGAVDVGDLVYMVEYSFSGGPAPVCQITTADITSIIPQDSSNVIQAYDTSTGAISLDETSGYAQQLAVGDILIGQDDSTAPHGFLRKVTSVSTQGSSIVLQTEQATMMEAFESMDISDSISLNPSKVRSLKLYNGTTFIPNKDGKTFDVSLNCVLYDQDGDPGTTDDQIRLGGNYSFTADLFAKVKISWFTLRKFEAGIKTNETANVDLIASLNWEFNTEEKFDLAQFRLGAIPLGGLVWLVPTLTVEAHIHGDLTVTFETGITYTQELRYGFGWADNAFYDISESTKGFTFTPPHFTAEFNFEPAVSLNASCLLYGVAGPYMAGKAGFHFQSVLDADLCGVDLNFNLNAILYAVVGVQCDIIGLDYNKEYQLYTHPIGEWLYHLSDVGTIVVDAEPNSISAPWTVTGPCSYSTSGNGDVTISDLDLGEYTITWGVVSGWTTPSNSTQTLTANGTVTFSGAYVAETGTVAIDPSPDAINAPWSLAGPNSYSANGTGDETLVDLTPGDYTITWGAVPGWITPANSTQTLTANETVTFSGAYVAETGTVAIDPSPDAINAPWSLAGPNSYSANGTGDETLVDLTPGDYTITWGAVPGWITPANSTQTLTGSGTVTFGGTYVEEGGTDSTGTVMDFDGNVYQTIKIGNQWWMAENLKVTHYRNGVPIPNVTDNTAWYNLTTGAYCDYGNNVSNVATYGRLYNWYAVADARNIAPVGWHVPSDAEWKQLEMYLGMSQADADATGWRGTDEGGKLKETGTSHWVSPNTGATNESGFSALPGGYRYTDGTFNSMGYTAYFWSSTENYSLHAWYRGLNYGYSKVYRISNHKPPGFSVRCVRDEDAGAAIIDAFPDSLNAPWSLAGQNSYSANGSGDETLIDLNPGDYTITWGAVPGWTTPANSTQTLTANGTVTFGGVYVEEGGPDSSGTVTDFDGNIYQTAKIGNQWWMAENLKVAHYQNGESIPNVASSASWGGLSTGAFCNYGNDTSQVATYGRLYNWFAVNDGRGIAPVGWHIATDDEWKQLEMYLGMSQTDADGVFWRGSDEGGKLKEAGTEHWNAPNIGATNVFWFSAIPGGYRQISGTFADMGLGAFFWSSTESAVGNAYDRRLRFDQLGVHRSGDYKPYGFSVRCVKN